MTFRHADDAVLTPRLLCSRRDTISVTLLHAPRLIRAAPFRFCRDVSPDLPSYAPDAIFAHDDFRSSIATTADIYRKSRRFKYHRFSLRYEPATSILHSRFDFHYRFARHALRTVVRINAGRPSPRPPRRFCAVPARRRRVAPRRSRASL